MGSAITREPRDANQGMISESLLSRKNMINNTSLSSMKSPVLEEAPKNSHKYVKKLEKQLQIKETKLPKNWINQVYFTPQSKFIIICSLIKLVLINIYFLEIPITIAFQKHRKEEDSERIFEQINIPAITFFIVSIGLKLKTAFYKEGVLIWSQRQILFNYLLYSFLFDFLSITSIIIYQFAQILNTSHSQPLKYRFIVIIFFLKIPETIRIQKSLISSFDLNRKTKAFIKLFLLLIKIFMICNIAACGFFYLSDNFCSSKTEQDFKRCWIDELEILGTSLRNSDNWTLQYSYSLYWAATTMLSIGYGDITPINGDEVVYVIIVEFVSCFVFGYSINQIWNIVQEKNYKKKKIHNRINIMNIYMRDKNVGVNLKSRINAYLSHFYHTKNVREKELQSEIIEELTPSLKKQLYFEAYGFIFATHQLFQYFSPEFLEEVSGKIYEVGYFEEEFIYSPEQQLQNFPLFYVQKGELQKQIMVGNSHIDNINLEAINKGTLLGVKEFITQNNYKASVIALKYSLIYRIDFSEWLKCLRDWEQDFQIYHLIKQRIANERNSSMLNLKCFICQKKGHESEECLDRGIRQNFESLVRKYLMKQQRTSYTRQRIRSSLNLSSSLSLTKIRKIPKFSSQSPRNTSFKKSLFQKKAHNEKMSLILERKKFKESIWTQSESSDEDIVGSVLNIDKVQNYEIYYPNLNASMDLQKKIRRTTINDILKI